MTSGEASVGSLAILYHRRSETYNVHASLPERHNQRPENTCIMNRLTNYAFLHGGGQGSWVWVETIEALGRQTDGAFGRALALDVPGCGAKTPRRMEDLTLDVGAAELIQDIEQAGLTEVVLVGHSQAGQAIPSMLQM